MLFPIFRLILLITIRYEVPEVVTGLIGVAFIMAAFLSAIARNRRQGGDEGLSPVREPELDRAAHAR